MFTHTNSTVQQNDSEQDRTQTTKEQYTNRQCTNWQKHNIQLCVRSDMCKFEMKIMCVPYLISRVHEMDCLREETVPVSVRSGVQSDSIS